MDNKVVITGLGIVSDIGDSVINVIQSIQAEDYRMSFLPNEEKYQNIKKIKVGKVNDITSDITDTDSLDKSEIMAMIALDEALCDAKISKSDLLSLGGRAAFSLSTSVMGSDYLVEFEKEEQKDYSWIRRSKAFISRITRRYNILGGCYTTSSACASGTAGLGIAFDLIKNDEADVVICCGTDHLSDISIFGFNSLDSLSDDVCKPFDDQRDGINIGEGCAVLIIESYEHAKKTNKTIYGEIIGYGLANDCYHMTSPDPEGKGAFFSMNMAIKDAELNHETNLYINAHGTGTKANDSMESKAISRLMEEHQLTPHVSSTKSLTGHCLGAAGSIEAALSLLYAKMGNFPNTYNSNLAICPSHSEDSQQIGDHFSYILSNSFAFGGNDASVLIKVGSYE